jgi:WD40 repeat protein
VVSGSADHTVRVWDATTGTPIGDPFTGHTNAVNAVALRQAEGRTVVVSGSDDRTMWVWDAATGTPISEHPCQDQRPLTLPSTIDLSAAVYGLATATPTSRLTAATELGIVSLRLPH